jgi:choline kinase
MRMIILAAGQGTRLRPLTDDRPKCLVELNGRPLLARTIETARAVGVTDIVVIGGYKIECLADYDVTVVANPDFASTNMVRTLFCAQSYFSTGFVMSYGDIVYTPEVLRKLLADPAPISVIVDRGWRTYWEQRFEDPLADAETLSIDAQGNIGEIGKKATSLDAVQAQYIGLVAFRGSGVQMLTDAYRAAQQQERAGQFPFEGVRSLDKLYMTDLLQGMIEQGHKLNPVTIDRGWVEIDSVGDLAVAEEIMRYGSLGEGA